MATITGKQLSEMIRHWLDTPVGAYLGSDYGQDAKALLQRALTDGAAEAFLLKLQKDIPLLQTLPAGAINIYGLSSGEDRVDLFIEVAGEVIQVGA